MFSATMTDMPRINSANDILNEDNAPGEHMARTFRKLFGKNTRDTDLDRFVEQNGPFVRYISQG